LKLTFDDPTYPAQNGARSKREGSGKKAQQTPTQHATKATISTILFLSTRSSQITMQQKPVLAVAIVTGVILVFIQIIGTCFEPGSQVSRSTRSKAVQPYHYTPSPLEQYFIDNSESLGLHKKELISTCALINDETSPIHKQTLSYFQELDTYNQVLKEFQPIQRDLRADILPGESNIEQVCSAVKIHNNGLQGIFNSGGTSSSTHAGGMEPLLPVMRNHKICPPFRTPPFDKASYSA
jgi:hypothetical protein